MGAGGEGGKQGNEGALPITAWPVASPGYKGTLIHLLHTDPAAPATHPPSSMYPPHSTHPLREKKEKKKTSSLFGAVMMGLNLKSMNKINQSRCERSYM